MNFKAIVLVLVFYPYSVLGHSKSGSRSVSEDNASGVVYSEQCLEGQKHRLVVHRIVTEFANVFAVVWKDQVVLVDAGDPFSWKKVRSYLEDRHLIQSVGLIFITHAHFDHAGGTKALARLTGADVLVHQGDQEDLSKGKTRVGEIGEIEWTKWLISPFVAGIVRYPRVDSEHTFNGRIVRFEEKFPGFLEELKVSAMNLAGHTQGSSVLKVLCGEKILVFTGDLVSNRNEKPHIQKSFAQDWDVLRLSYHALLSFRPDVFFPGHGPIFYSGELNDISQ